MVSVSNGFLSDENVVRSRIENGNCSLTCGGSARPLKWKPRKVSAVRDFPQGCGPNFQPVNVVSREEAPSLLVKDTVDSIGVNGAGRSTTGAECSEREDALELSVEPHKMEMEALVNKELQNGDSHLLKEVCAPVNGVVQVAVEPLSPTQGTSNGGNVNEVTVPKNKFPQRRVSAVRDFPPYCGLNAPEPTEEERARITGKRSSLAKDKGDGGSVRLKNAITVGCKGLNRNVEDGIVQKTQSDDPINRSPMSSQEGGVTVTALPFKGLVGDKVGVGCQSLAEANIEGDDESKRDVLDGTARVQNSEPEVIGVEPRNKLHSAIQKGGKGIAGQASQDLVVYSRDKNLKRRHSVDADDDKHKGKFEENSVQSSESEDMFTESNNISSGIIQSDRNHFSRQLRGVGHETHLKTRPLDEALDYGCIRQKRTVVMGLMAPKFCPFSSVKEGLTGADGRACPSQSKLKTHASIAHKKSKKKRNFVDEKSNCSGKVAYTGTLDVVVKEEEDFNEEERENSPDFEGPHDVEVTLPPFGPKSTSDARNKVRETLRLFHFLCRKLLQGEEAKTKEGDESKPLQPGKELRRIDLAVVKILKEKGKELKTGLRILGAVPGVEVGDEFQYRVELALVGVHRLYQAGIDYFKQGKEVLAASIVASGGYNDILDNPDCLIYSGSGKTGKDKQPENQKLERGNLALKNSVYQKNPVRVIRGSKETKAAESFDGRAKVMITYVYDGLYTVERYWQELGPQGNVVYKFELKRMPGQPELALKEVKKSKKFKTREGLCVDDITGGKELSRISAVNTIDNEKPPPFTYITKMIYPDWYRGVPPKGCDCTGRCCNKRCSCAFRNGGEIPYNHNGAIVEAKTLVYECGPSCKCPPTCYNRVTQQGMKIQLEIFKTESRGWGVRSLNSISSGSFICEYIGELLEDREAEARKGNDEYLFDIGQNYSDCSLSADAKLSSSEVMEEGGFTIDAAHYGNVGRFINHSCSPNLYAQNVLYDLEDKRMPHIMFFAAENIPPLQELTYHYNYAVNTVHDSDGNIKIKKCYCGSSECTGRLY